MAEKKLQINRLALILKSRRILPPAGKPFKDKKRQSKLDATGRKAKHKKGD